MCTVILDFESLYVHIHQQYIINLHVYVQYNEAFSELTDVREDGQSNLHRSLRVQR